MDHGEIRIRHKESVFLSFCSTYHGNFCLFLFLGDFQHTTIRYLDRVSYILLCAGVKNGGLWHLLQSGFGSSGEGRKPGVFMNPRVIPTCIAFWPGEKELNLHIKHTTLEPKFNQLFLNLGRVSHECR